MLQVFLSVTDVAATCLAAAAATVAICLSLRLLKERMAHCLFRFDPTQWAVFKHLENQVQELCVIARVVALFALVLAVRAAGTNAQNVIELSSSGRQVLHLALVLARPQNIVGRPNCARHFKKEAARLVAFVEQTRWRHSENFDYFVDLIELV